jgi:uncharacterized membrane protein
MLKLFKEKNRLGETIFMGTLSVLCFSFSIFRFVYSDTKIFLFLNWNLFLAFIPWVLTTIAVLRPNILKTRLIILILLGSWLLFFPNAPYILTDLFHLRHRASMPIWFDLVLILSFAWTGLLFGMLSLLDIEKIMGKLLHPFLVKVISAGLLFLGSFGIYLGRYLRWNSWDMITEPFRLIYDIRENIINPFGHLRAWGMTIFMGLFLNMIYWSFRLIRKRNG